MRRLLPLVLVLFAFMGCGKPETVEELNASAEPDATEELNATAKLIQEAEAGDVVAQMNLAGKYFRGEGVSKDSKEGVKWLLKAADQGYAEAQYRLGFIYSKRTRADPLGLSKNYEEAAKWYRKAADQGHAEAQLNLGSAYNHGLGLPEDALEAIKWYIKAAEQGNARAAGLLGFKYNYGRGVPKDLVNAYAWLKLAEHHGDDRANGPRAIRERIAKRMTPEQISRAQELFEELLKKIDAKQGPADAPDLGDTKAPASRDDPPEEGQAFTVPVVSLGMLWCKPGTFTMGSSENKEKGRAETRHEVTLTKGFWLGKHEVTQTQWKEVMGTTPSSIKGADRPVEGVSWNDATAFCEKLTEMERTAGRLSEGWVYKLPTEAQWEYACRAGTSTAFAFGDTLSSSQAKIKGRATVPVGSYEANAWGFHDMHGNVYEWCHDWYGVYPSGPVHDPLGPLVGSLRVRRGGAWYFHGNLHRPDDLSNLVNSSDRFKRIPDDKSPIQGFRVSLRWVQDSVD